MLQFKRAKLCFSNNTQIVLFFQRTFLNIRLALRLRFEYFGMARKNNIHLFASCNLIKIELLVRGVMNVYCDLSTL